MRIFYLLTFSDLHYAVCKDEVESVRKVETIHRLPFSPACIAGLAIIDKQSTALADLAALIGLAPFAHGAEAQLMFIAGQKKDAAFVVSGDIAEISIPEESVLPMPNYITTPEISSCIIYQGKPLPLIDLKALYQHIHSRDLNPSVPTFPVPGKDQPPAQITRIKLFTAGGEVFALSADLVSNASDKPLEITRIPLTPSFLMGIIADGSAVSPVIDLANKMNLPNPGNTQKLLMLDIGGDNFGFLVDEDLGTLAEKDFSISPLPPLAKSPLISAAAMRGQDIIPIIDPRAIIDPEPTKPDDPALVDQYHPESDFGDRFDHENVEIVEFMLLGERHALPRTEVGDILPITPFRRVPDLQSLVIGITEYQGEIIPVLDLALVPGRRSLISSDWQMILVNNGNFRAFIITEAIHPERTLPLSLQKKVPISLPHRLVYGCYPDGNIVRLIVNVAALAIHFDKMVVKKFLSSLTKEMAATAAEIVPALLPAEEVQRIEKEAQLRELAEPFQPEKLFQADTEGGEKQVGPEEARPEEPTEIEEKPAITGAEEFQQGEAELPATPDTEQIPPAEELIVREHLPESGSTISNHDLATSTVRPKLLRDEDQQLKDRKSAEISGNVEQLTKSLAAQLDQLDEGELTPHDIEKVPAWQGPEALREEQINDKQIRQVAEKERLEREQQAAIKAEEEHLKREEEAERARTRTREILARHKQDAQDIAIAKEKRLRQEEELQKQKLAAEAEKKMARTREILAQQKQKAQALAIAQRERLQQAELDKQKMVAEAEEERRRILEQQKQKEAFLKAEEARIRLEEFETAQEEAAQRRREIEAENKAAAQALQMQAEERQTRETLEERARLLAKFREKKQKDQSHRKRLLVLLFLLLFLLLDIFIFFDVTEEDKPVPPVDIKVLREEKAIVHDTKSTPDLTPPKKEEERLPVKSAAVRTKPPSPKKEAQPPLTIIVPDNIPLKTQIYKVKKGDTLWAISMRFTGNPYNYPFVAQENDINNPDLIFPEQPILLKRKNGYAPESNY